MPGPRTAPGRRTPAPRTPAGCRRSGPSPAAGPSARIVSRSRSGTRLTRPGTVPARSPGNMIIHTHGTVPKTMPTSASDLRHAHADAAPLRRWASAHTANAANGSAATVMRTTPRNVPNQPCHPSAMPPPLPSDREAYPGPGRGRVVMVWRFDASDDDTDAIAAARSALSQKVQSGHNAAGRQLLSGIASRSGTRGRHATDNRTPRVRGTRGNPARMAIQGCASRHLRWANCPPRRSRRGSPRISGTRIGNANCIAPTCASMPAIQRRHPGAIRVLFRRCVS